MGVLAVMLASHQVSVTGRIDIAYMDISVVSQAYMAVEMFRNCRTNPRRTLCTFPLSLQNKELLDYHLS